MPNPQRRLPCHALSEEREKGGGKAELGREKGLLVSVVRHELTRALTNGARERG